MSKKLSKQQEILDEAKTRTAEISAEASKAIDEFIGETVHVSKRERPKNLEVVSTGASYHNFKEEAVFQGNYVNDFLAPKDMVGMNGEIQPKGTVIGFNFIDDLGKMSIISNSHSIKEALKADGFKQETIWWIEFEGRVEIKGKRPFNKFYIAKVK